jgi:6-phosphofructokinase 2
MTFALAKGWTPDEALRLGVAAGAAAVLTPGTALCRREDVLRLYAETGRGERVA